MEGVVLSLLVFSFIAGFTTCENAGWVTPEEMSRAAKACENINSEIKRVYNDNDILCKNGIEINYEDGKYPNEIKND